MSGIKGMKWGFEGRPEDRIKIKYEKPDPFKVKCSELRFRYRIDELNEEDKERLALKLLLDANGDEKAHNEACDIIKALGLIKGYQ